MASENSSTDGMGDQIGGETADLDGRVLDLLAWALDTETKARIYVTLRTCSPATSAEIAEETKLYPSTVREALATLHDEEVVTREKRAADRAGNNPYEYETIPPAELVGEIVEDVQSELNTVFNLDAVLAGENPERTPVSIAVESDDD